MADLKVGYLVDAMADMTDGRKADHLVAKWAVLRVDQLAEW